MDVTDAAIRKLALKLVEVFALPQASHTFARYWPLAGRLEVFAAQARGPLEEAVAQALRSALESILERSAGQASITMQKPL